MQSNPVNISNLLSTVNTLLEDSSVLVVVAYLMTRGRALRYLFPGRPHTLREALLLGCIIGFIGNTEYLWPGQRYPYSLLTLFIAFSALLGGRRVAAVTTCILILGAFFVPHPSLTTMASIALGAPVALLFRKMKNISVRPFLTGAVTQAVALIPELVHTHLSMQVLLIQILANGVGLSLLMLIAHDAQQRAHSAALQIQTERLRAETEQARALAVHHQMSALRARLHPHFLFNTLTAIASLCGTDPTQAEAMTVLLADLMRRALATGTHEIPVREEIAAVTNYLRIERLRYGGLLRVEWHTEEAIEGIYVPSFSLLTLVENAILHGISRKIVGGTVHIVIRRRLRAVMIAVGDDGVGMTTERRRAARTLSPDRMHGLVILDQQLQLQFGKQARLRLFSEYGRGTLVAFCLPTG